MYLLGCVVLVSVILVFLFSMGAPVVQFSDMDTSSVTDKPIYTVGEIANVSVVVSNPGPRPVLVKSFNYVFPVDSTGVR